MLQSHMHQKLLTITSYKKQFFNAALSQAFTNYSFEINLKNLILFALALNRNKMQSYAMLCSLISIFAYTHTASLLLIILYYSKF